MDSGDQYDQYRAANYQPPERIPTNPGHPLSLHAPPHPPATEHANRSTIPITGAQQLQPSAPYGNFAYSQTSTFSESPTQVPRTQATEMQYTQEYLGGRARQQSGQQPSQSQYASYSSDVAYPSGPQAPSYTTIPQYQQQQHGSRMELSSQYGAAQYYPPGDATANTISGVPTHQYIGGQLQQNEFSEPIAGERSPLGQSFNLGMAQYPPETAPSPVPEHMEAQDADKNYERFQARLKHIFSDIQAGKLVEAAKVLYELTDWLSEIFIAYDDKELYQDRIEFWRRFNDCWLALFQKQKDLTEEMLRGGRRMNIMELDDIRKMGDAIVALSDKLDPHGLVDYEMGAWEEDIMEIIIKCRQLLETPQAQASSLLLNISHPGP